MKSLKEEKDDVELRDGVLPKYFENDFRDIIKEEENRYLKCVNELIEIQIGAEEGLGMLR